MIKTISGGQLEKSDLSPKEVRIVQAITDFQMALSAVDFLSQADPDMPISRIERRRLRCFEDAAVVAYWRPFSRSHGLPTISLEELGIKPTPDQITLHERLKKRRNKVVAHTDADRMRLAFNTIKIFDDEIFMLPQVDFDDSLEFYPDREALLLWVRTLVQAAARTIIRRVQRRSQIRFIRDYTNQIRLT